MAAVKNNREDLAMLAEVRVSVKYLEKALDGLQAANKEQTTTLLSALQTHGTDDTTRFEKHDVRLEKHDSWLKSLDNWRWYILGIAATIGFVAWLWK